MINACRTAAALNRVYRRVLLKLGSVWLCPSTIGFIGLRDESALRSMTAEYAVYFSSPADPQQGDDDKDHHEKGIDSDNYFVQHTSPAYLIDHRGFLRVVYFNGTAPEIIAQGIRQILQEAS